jgi:hypothetical protein
MAFEIVSLQLPEKLIVVLFCQRMRFKSISSALPSPNQLKCMEAVALQQ